MRAILINAETRTIQEVHAEHSLEWEQEQVGGFIEAALYFENDDVLFCNEEGLLTNPEHFTLWDQGHQLLTRAFAGNLVLVGGDGEGGSADAKTNLEVIENMCSFANVKTIRLLAAQGKI